MTTNTDRERALEIFRSKANFRDAVFSAEEYGLIEAALTTPQAEIDIPALKREIGACLSKLIPNSYSENTMLNTVDYIASGNPSPHHQPEGKPHES